MNSKQSPSQSGMMIAMIIIVLTFLITVGVLTMDFVLGDVLISRGRTEDTMAFMSADAGLEKTLFELNEDEDYPGSGGEIELGDNDRYYITYETEVESGLLGSSRKVILATGRLYRKPNLTDPVSVRSVRLEVQAGSSAFEHTLQTGSGSLYAYGNFGLSGDIFASNIIGIQNIAVSISGTIKAAGKDASDCSISGVGSINSSTINTRYDVCGVSTTGSSVTENDTTVLPKPLPVVDKDAVLSDVTSNRDCSAVNGPLGLPPYLILPAHYPDDGDDTVGGCNISLINNRPYILSGDIHVRGNFSGSNNVITTTGSNDIYVLVEGDININRVRVTGTAPVVFVSYSSTDSGGSQSAANAIEIAGNNLSLNAYFLAPNGSIGFGGSSAAGASVGAMAAQSIVLKGSGVSVFLDIYPQSLTADRIWRPLQYQRSYEDVP